MDIHKPKPIHGWRDFLKEIGVIVLGVSIALAAEQAVEWAHWRNQVAIARQSLLAEMKAAEEFYAYRIAISSCVDRKIGEVDQAIRDIAAKRVPGPVDISVRGIGALLSDSEWQSERSAQTVTHFPRGELALMGRFYAQLRDFSEWETKEAEALWNLRILENGPEGLDLADLAQLRINLQVARHYEFLIANTARGQLALSEKLGIPYVKADPERVEKFCTLNDADYVRYLKTGEPR